MIRTLNAEYWNSDYELEESNMMEKVKENNNQRSQAQIINYQYRKRERNQNLAKDAETRPY